MTIYFALREKKQTDHILKHDNNELLLRLSILNKVVVYARIDIPVDFPLIMKDRNKSTQFSKGYKL